MIKGSITFITLHLIWHTARMRCKDRSLLLRFSDEQVGKDCPAFVILGAS